MLEFTKCLSYEHVNKHYICACSIRANGWLGMAEPQISMTAAVRVLARRLATSSVCQNIFCLVLANRKLTKNRLAVRAAQGFSHISQSVLKNN